MILGNRFHHGVTTIQSKSEKLHSAIFPEAAVSKVNDYDYEVKLNNFITSVVSPNQQRLCKLN